MRHHNKGAHILVSQTLMQMEEKITKKHIFSRWKNLYYQCLCHQNDPPQCAIHLHATQ